MSDTKDPAESHERIQAMAVDTDAPAEAPPPGGSSRVEDRLGNELKVGDHVEIVFGGEYHRTTIDKISPIKTNYGVVTDHHMVEATITVHVHAAAVTKLHDHPTDKPAADPRSQTSQPKPAAARADVKANPTKPQPTKPEPTTWQPKGDN